LHFPLNQFSLTSLQARVNHKKLLAIHRSKRVLQDTLMDSHMDLYIFN